MDVDKWLGSITLYEAAQIWARLNSTCNPNALVLWTGIHFDLAAEWAREHNRKTLTQALGPLMDRSSPTCRFHLKNPHQWALYVHAASILFTLFISTGDEVVVLVRHPPERFDPNRRSYYQNIEEPWLTSCCDRGRFKIMLAHPRVTEARDYMYQYWPVDNVQDWITTYPNPQVGKAWAWQCHYWDSVQSSTYQPQDLMRERANIMQKLYLYKTGATIYWRVTCPTNKAPSKKRCDRCDGSDSPKPSKAASNPSTETATKRKVPKGGGPRATMKPALKSTAPSAGITKKKKRKKKKKRGKNSQPEDGPPPPSPQGLKVKSASKKAKSPAGVVKPKPKKKKTTS